MKILQVVHRYPPAIGGAENYFFELAKHCAGLGHQVEVITTDAVRLEEFWSKGRASNEGEKVNHDDRITIRRFPLAYLPFHHLMMRVLHRLPLGFWKSRFALPNPMIPSIKKALRSLREKPNLIITGALPYHSFIAEAVEAGEKYQAPVVVLPFTHVGESDQSPLRRYYGNPYQVSLLNKAQYVVAQTEIEKNFLIQRGVRPEKLSVIGPGIHLRDVTGGDAERFRLRYRLRRPIVFYLGMKAYDKGTVHLAEAMKLLWAQGEEADLVLAGPSLPNFKKWFKKKEKIVWLEEISEEEKKDLFAAGDLFVMPSRTDSFGIVFLEAWANQKPVIGARAGGVTEVIHPDSDGVLVEFGDVSQLAARIRELLRDPAKRNRLGSEGYHRVVSGLTWERRWPLWDRLTGRNLLR